MADNLTLIDSDILIDIGRKNLTAIERIEDVREKSVTAISVVTQMELIVGCRDKTELKYLGQFFEDSNRAIKKLVGEILTFLENISAEKRNNRNDDIIKNIKGIDITDIKNIDKVVDQLNKIN